MLINKDYVSKVTKKHFNLLPCERTCRGNAMRRLLYFMEDVEESTFRFQFPSNKIYYVWTMKALSKKLGRGITYTHSLIREGELLGIFLVGPSQDSLFRKKMKVSIMVTCPKPIPGA